MFINDLARVILSFDTFRIAEIIHETEKEPDAEEHDRHRRYVKQCDTERDIANDAKERKIWSERYDILPLRLGLLTAQLDICEIKLKKKSDKKNVRQARNVFERKK